MKLQTHKILFALYTGFAMPVLVIALASMPTATDAASLFNSPHWPAIGVAVLVGIFVIVPCVLLESRIRIICARSFRAGIYHGMLVLIPSLALFTIFYRNLSFHFIIDATIYAGVIALIGGLRQYEESFDYLEDRSLNSDTKRALLDKSYDFLTRGLAIFTTVYFGGLVGGTLAFVIGKDLNEREIASIFIVLSYLTLGVVPGVYVRMLRKLLDVRSRYTSIH